MATPAAQAEINTILKILKILKTTSKEDDFNER